MQALSPFGSLPAGVDLIVMRQEKISAAKVAATAAKVVSASSAPASAPPAQPLSSPSVQLSAVPALKLHSPAAAVVVPVFCAEVLADAIVTAAQPPRSSSPSHDVHSLEVLNCSGVSELIAYCGDIEFAAQLCDQFAAQEGSNYDVSVPLQDACSVLQRINASMPHVAELKAAITKALADAEATVRANPRKQLKDSDDAQVRALLDEQFQRQHQLNVQLSLTQNESESETNRILHMLEGNERQARSAAARDITLIEQQFGEDRVQVQQMEEEETRAISQKNYKAAQEVNTRLNAYRAECLHRVQGPSAQRTLQLEQQLSQLRAASMKSISDATQRVAAMQCSVQVVVAFHRQQLQQFHSAAAQRLKKMDESMSCLSALISQAQELLSRQPAWPQHRALLRFGHPLQLLTSPRCWAPGFFVMKDLVLYRSDGNNGYANTLEGALAFSNSHPAADGNYCIDLRGSSVACCGSAVDGASYVFSITKQKSSKQTGGTTYLSAADDATRQLCVRSLEACIAGGFVSSLQSIASAAALTRGLFRTKSSDAVSVVLSALNIGFDQPSLSAANFSFSSLKEHHFQIGDLRTCGFDAAALRLGHFTAAELHAAGFDLQSLIAARYGLEELKNGRFTPGQFKVAGCSVQELRAAGFSEDEIKTAGFTMAELCLIVLASPSNPQVMAIAQAYYKDIEFASQLCSEFAAAEISSPVLSLPLSEAHRKLQLIVASNSHLQSPPSTRPPAWPPHQALIRFDLPLQRLTTHFAVSKKWFPRHFSLRGSRLYHCDGKNGHPDTAQGALAFMRSNPAADGHYCMDLKGAHARCDAADFAGRVCDSRAQAAVSRQASHPSMGRLSRSRSSSHQGMRCISVCMHALAHKSHASSRLRRVCSSPLPMKSRASAACAPFKPRVQAAASPR